MNSVACSNGVDLFEYELNFAKFKTCYQENICIYRLYRYAKCNLDKCEN